MKTFFLQLFLSFWLAAIGIFVGSALIFPDSALAPEANFHAAGEATNRRIADDTLAALASGGCDAVRRINGAYTLLTPEANAVCSEPITADERALALKSHPHPHGFGQRGHVGSNWVEVRAARSSDGRRWLLLQRTPYVAGLGLPPLPHNALPLSIAVTLLLAFLLLRPVRRLSQAFRGFAAGDLSVRLPVAKGWWSSIGGSDMRTLMLDFNHMADRVDELIKAQRLLVRDISHELRSPLARLRLALEMAREESTEPLPSLDRMEAEAERVNELIGQMLSLSLLESTRELHPETMRVEDVIASITADMEFEAASRGCAFVARLQPLPLTSGNPELLRRAIENVTRNAIRFTAKGSQVVIEASLQGAPALAILVLVKDSGPGVAEASLPHIFRPFYRTDAARGETTGGFGVGLAIAERAVSLHGGTIQASNRPEGGLQIRILLPVAPSLSGHSLEHGLFRNEKR